MARLDRLNIISTAHTGNLELPPSPNRGYFMIIMVNGTGTIEFGEGGGQIPLAQGIFYEPIVAPTSKITIVTTASYVIAMGG